jgi:REP-associated tyrosine transposase
MPSGIPTARKRRSALAAAPMSIPLCHANPLHVVAGARTFFVTSSTSNKTQLLQSTRAAELFVRVLYEYRAGGKFRLHGFVVMPDHFHVLLTIESDTTIERAVQLIKGGFAFRAGKELGFRAPVWQKGFSEIRVSDAATFARQRDYIHNNPVARFLTSRPEDYPYSSAHSGFEVDPPPQRLKPASLDNQSGMAEAMP